MSQDHNGMQMNVTHADIRSLKMEVEQVSLKVNEVHLALIGSTLSEDGGMVRRLKDCEHSVEKLHVKISEIEDGNIKSELYLKIIWGLAGVISASIFGYALKIAFTK